MTKEILKQNIEGNLLKGADFECFRDILFQFKEHGGTQEEAYNILTELRNVAENESDEDNILDIMDLVKGWCRPDYKIW